MRNDVSLGAFLDGEGVLQDGRAVLFEAHHSLARVDLERAGHRRSLHTRCNRLAVDLNVEVLTRQTLHDIDLGVIGVLPGLVGIPAMSQIPATSRANFDHRATCLVTTPCTPPLCSSFLPLRTQRSKA